MDKIHVCRKQSSETWRRVGW